MNIGMDAELKAKMCIEHDFNGCRYNNGVFDFHNWQLKINLAVYKQEDEEDAHKNLSIAFQKLNFFLQCFLTEVFVVCSHDLDVIEGFAVMDLDNNVILLPEGTTDDILVQAIHSKIATLTKDILYIGEVSLRCVQTKSSFHYNAFDGKYDLPTQEEFLGEHALHYEPWWCRYDCDTFDTMVPEGEDRDKKISDTDTSRLLDDLETSIIKDMEGNDGKPKETRIIKMAEATEIWKPKES
jgi:hypothetical protein